MVNLGASRTLESDPWYRVLQRLPEAVDGLPAARERAKHYRGFKVAAAGIAEMPDSSLEIFYGANRNDPTGLSRKCAEIAMLETAEAAEAKRVLAIAVSGPWQRDTHSGVITPTLQPCGTCRHDIPASPLVGPELLVVPVNPDLDAYEAHDLNEIQAIHGANLCLREEDTIIDLGFRGLRNSAEDYAHYQKTYGSSIQLAKIVLQEVNASYSCIPM